MKILMDAGPWLAVPPRGYGGLENVVATLTTELRSRGHHVVLATVGDSDLPAEQHVWAFPTGQFARLAGNHPPEHALRTARQPERNHVIFVMHNAIRPGHARHAIYSRYVPHDHCVANREPPAFWLSCTCHREATKSGMVNRES